MSRRVLYMIIHTPVELGRPVQVGYVPKAEWSDKLFKTYMADVEENRKLGGGRITLSKRDIERWGFFPPCGARFEVIEVELPPEPELK